MTLALCVATMDSNPPCDTHPHWPGDIQTWVDRASTDLQAAIHYNSPSQNLGVVRSYELLYQRTTEDVLCYLHDDVICREDGWDERVQMEFEDPKVGIVGFGGAYRHGDIRLYKHPYQLNDLARFGYISNVDDAETHGTRFTGSTDVAVLDGFALCIKRSLLDHIGGFKLLVDNQIDFICYDYAICALARRCNYRIRYVGIRCHHRGGQTSAKMNVDRQEEYDRSHRWFYEEFRDVMPYDVTRASHQIQLR